MNAGVVARPDSRFKLIENKFNSKRLPVFRNFENFSKIFFILFKFFFTILKKIFFFHKFLTIFPIFRKILFFFCFCYMTRSVRYYIFFSNPHSDHCKRPLHCLDNQQELGAHRRALPQRLTYLSDQP